MSHTRATRSYDAHSIALSNEPHFKIYVYRAYYYPIGGKRGGTHARFKCERITKCIDDDHADALSVIFPAATDERGDPGTVEMLSEGSGCCRNAFSPQILDYSECQPER